MTRHSPFASPSLSMPTDPVDRRPGPARPDRAGEGGYERAPERVPLRADLRRDVQRDPSSEAHRGTHRDPGQIRPSESRFDARAWRDSQRQELLPEPQSAAPETSTPAAAVIATMRAPIAGGSASRWRYIALWAGLGTVSAAYVAGMAWQRSTNFDVVMAPVTEALERIAADVADLRTITTNLDNRERATVARLSAAETRLNGLAQAAQPMVAVTPSPQPVAASVGQRPTNRAVLAEDGAAAVATAAEPPKANGMMPGVVLAQPIPGAPPVEAKAQPSTTTAKQAATNAVRTGSLSTPAAPTGPRQPGLLVASGPSLDAVRLSWNVLTQNHGAVLGNLEPKTLTAGNGNIVQLIAGPFPTDLDAQKACALLRSRGVTCRMTDYAGAPL
jgi:hypothetical protein